MSDALKRAKAKYYQKIKDDPNYKEKMANNSKRYYEQNKEKLQEYYKNYSKQYYEQNKERKNEYYEENKEKIKIKAEEKFVCECGCTIQKGGLYRNLKSDKHTKDLKSIPNE